jgi:hypothetical protein
MSVTSETSSTTKAQRLLGLLSGNEGSTAEREESCEPRDGVKWLYTELKIQMFGEAEELVDCIIDLPILGFLCN